jgi:hypothetical protein
VRTVGFTGTRQLTKEDYGVITGVIKNLPDDVRVVNGGCVGADTLVARYAFLRSLHVHTIFPSDLSHVDPDAYRWCTTSERMPEGSSYRDRDRRIVEESDVLIAFAWYPEHYPRSRRSGTWMTARIAKGRNVPVLIYILNEGDIPCTSTLRTWLSKHLGPRAV